MMKKMTPDYYIFHYRKLKLSNLNLEFLYFK